MNKTAKIVIALCLLFCIINTAFTAFMLDKRTEPATPTATRYTLYIGTNDKDTYTQLISTEKAMEIVNEICVRHVGGYTVSTAHGGWMDEAGVMTNEETLVYTFLDAEEEQIIRIMDEVRLALNQNSILCEQQSVIAEFYPQ